MVGVKIPDTLNEYANLITGFDNDLRFLDQKPAPFQKKQNYQKEERTFRKDPDAMDLDHASTGYAPKGSRERERRQKLGLCFKCGSHDHISPKCSVPIPLSAVQTATIGSMRSVVDDGFTRVSYSKSRQSARSSRSSSGSSRSSSRSSRHSRTSRKSKNEGSRR